MSRSKNFTFTWNNYPPDAKEQLVSLNASYVCYSHEEAPTTGTLHLQGYICFPNARYLSAVKKLVKPNWWIDVSKGDLNQNQDYVSKVAEMIVIGKPPKSKAQVGADEAKRWKLVKEAAVAGRLDDIPEDIYVRYYSTLKKIAADHTPPPATLDTLENKWLWGPSGCGKSKLAREMYPDAYIKDPKEKWWDGYVDQEAVIIDDFDKFDVAQSGNMKRWVDHYPFPAQFKGSTKLIRPKFVIVTSNYAPEEIWQDVHTLEPINRRFNVIHMGPHHEAYASIFTK